MEIDVCFWGAGGSVVPLFAECFELRVDLGRFGPRATSRSRRQNWQLRLLVGWALAPNAPAENPVWCYLLIYLFCARISQRCSSFVGGNPGDASTETLPPSPGGRVPRRSRGEIASSSAGCTVSGLSALGDLGFAPRQGLCLRTGLQPPLHVVPVLWMHNVPRAKLPLFELPCCFCPPMGP